MGMVLHLLLGYVNKLYIEAYTVLVVFFFFQKANLSS